MFLIDWVGGSWQASATLVLGTLIVYVGALWLTLIFWAYRDARRRSRSATFQASAVALVAFFFVPGLWLYMLMRPRLTLSQQYAASLEEEALLQELDEVLNCPGCTRRVHNDYLVCPSCLIELKTPCERCEKPLAHAWLACAFCGKRRRETAAATPGVIKSQRANEPVQLQPEEIPVFTPMPSGVPAGGAGS